MIFRMIDFSVCHARDADRLTPLHPAQATDDDALAGMTNIVALAGAEQIQAAINTGADVVLAGRATDTAMIAAVTAAIGSYAPITTVDIASRFLRPLGAEGGDVIVEILMPGRRLVVGRITINDRASGKLAADLSSTYARL